MVGVLSAPYGFGLEKQVCLEEISEKGVICDDRNCHRNDSFIRSCDTDHQIDGQG